MTRRNKFNFKECVCKVVYTTVRIIMRFHKSYHMPCGKLIPPVTLTLGNITETMVTNMRNKYFVFFTALFPSFAFEAFFTKVEFPSNGGTLPLQVAFQLFLANKKHFQRLRTNDLFQRSQNLKQTARPPPSEIQKHSYPTTSAPPPIQIENCDQSKIDCSVKETQ